MQKEGLVARAERSGLKLEIYESVMAHHEHGLVFHVLTSDGKKKGEMSTVEDLVVFLQGAEAVVGGPHE